MKKSKLCAFFLCATMLITLLPTAALAETSIVEYVDYDITADTTWHAGDYYICKVGNREPRVTNGATLTIESGAKVYFSRRTTAPLPGTEIEPKNPYSSLTVTNGTLSATGVTFTTVPDAPEQTTWQDAGWNGIQAIGAGTAGATSLSFTNCTFEYSGFDDAGTLYGTQTNSIDSEVNISVTGCTFRNPNARTTAIRYNNGYNTIGSGTVSVSNSSITGYGRGVQVAQNGEDAVNTTVSGCTFSNISIRPLEINGGRQAVITGNSFNNFVTGQHDYPVLIYDGYSPTSAEQTVTLTGNTFNYGTDANIYPVVIGAGCKINEDITNPNNTFDAAYPAAFRYIVLSRGVGYLNNHRNAVWGDAGIPYLLASEIIVTGTDETNQSSLTIKPGVIVCLGDGIGSDNLTVRGTLAAEGTAAKPITFTKKAGLTYGNTISASVNLRGGSITLKYCVMDGLYRGIEITSPSTTAGLISLENCTVQNSQHSMLLKGYNVSVKNCVIIGKGVETGGGDYVNSTTIEDCSITASGAGSDNGGGDPGQGTENRDFTVETTAAERLKVLGLFQGVGTNPDGSTNFDLARKPSRTEALVMLIRLLGKDNEALSESWTHPFTDVPKWADNYVGYAYENKLTNGISATKFGTGTATYKTYLTFVLRALGYSDEGGVDFTWDMPDDLALPIGIMVAGMHRENFLRADVVLVSEAALNAMLKDGSNSLLDKLIEDGAVTQTP